MSNWELSSTAKQKVRARIAEHSVAKDAAELAAKQRRDAENSAARQKYLNGLESERKERQKAADQALDAEFEPKKRSLMRDWMISNPGKVEADFERLAWPLLRQNLVEQHRDAMRQASREESRRHLSGALAL